MHELALFAGAGGGLLGSRLLGWRKVGAVEIDPYCREVLLRRQGDGLLDLFPIWDDARTFDGRPWRGKVDCVSAGFPCQPFSVAGRRRGEDDERNLWPDTIRIIREVGPRFCLLENVPGLLARDYFGTILGDLAASGFNAEWGVLSAAAVGANHLRRRLWIVAHAEGEPRSRGDQDSSLAAATQDEPRGLGKRVLWWDTIPTIPRMDDGMALGLERYVAPGQAQVPAVVRAAWRELMRRLHG